MNKIKQILKRYFGYFTYFYEALKYRLFISLVFSLCVGVLDGFGLAMFMPLFEMVGSDTATNNESLGNLSFLLDFINYLGLTLNLNVVLMFILFFFSLKGLAKFVESYYKVKVKEYFTRGLRTRNVDSLANYEYKSFVGADAGRIQNTLSGETNKVVAAYRTYFTTIQFGIMLSVYVVMAYLANPKFALLVTVGGVLSNLFFKFIYRSTVRLSRKLTAENHEYQGFLMQLVSFFKYLKATGRMSQYADKLKNAIYDIEVGTRKMGFYDAILVSVREPLVMLVVVSVILLQVNYFGEPLSSLILSLLFFYRALTFVISMQGEYNRFLTVSGSLENIDDFQQMLDRGREADGHVTMERFSHHIQLKDVYFSYTNTPVINGLSMSIERNKTYAFVGESGSGKTTLVNLVAGLIPLEKGEIIIDNVSINELDKSAYRSLIGYITQEPVIFSDTVFNNVSFWQPNTEENLRRFWDCLEKASIADYVRQMNEKEEALLGINGVNLSGGQKQRISIARELYKGNDLLIMDEATSALDTATENDIKNSIDSIKGNYTILIVAHRLSTIRNADFIVLMNQGQIEEVGTYDQLIEKSDSFKRMVSLQEI